MFEEERNHWYAFRILKDEGCIQIYDSARLVHGSGVEYRHQVWSDLRAVMGKCAAAANCGDRWERVS